MNSLGSLSAPCFPIQSLNCSKFKVPVQKKNPMPCVQGILIIVAMRQFQTSYWCTWFCTKYFCPSILFIKAAVVATATWEPGIRFLHHLLSLDFCTTFSSWNQWASTRPHHQLQTPSRCWFPSAAHPCCNQVPPSAAPSPQ